ncbi:MAG TPA: molybdopterin-guanine dinucleotide biosynthesis protein B [Dehalococcoidales bacterium]|nr:molybdopterin-guanine dinucleotide biosynthesis protein B [Dehalococcoidales bacterium]
MPPVVSIVGKSSTGKTTFLEKLVRELKARGYRVGTIKHSHHSIDFHDPKKDSFRHAQAGAAATLVSSTTSFQIIKPVPRELNVEELVRHFGNDFDLILTEGFSRGNAPKVEIHRKEAGPLLEVASKLFAVVTDEPLDTDAQQFGLEDIKGVADLIENRFIKPGQPRLSLYVNGRAVEISAKQAALLKNLVNDLEPDFKETGINSLELHYHPYRK